MNSFFQMTLIGLVLSGLAIDNSHARRVESGGIAAKDPERHQNIHVDAVSTCVAQASFTKQDPEGCAGKVPLSNHVFNKIKELTTALPEGTRLQLAQGWWTGRLGTCVIEPSAALRYYCHGLNGEILGENMTARICQIWCMDDTSPTIH